MRYNKAKAKNLILTAERSIKIIRMLLEDSTDQDIIAQTGAQRQLVEYYRKTLMTKETLWVKKNL